MKNTRNINYFLKKPLCLAILCTICPVAWSAVTYSGNVTGTTSPPPADGSDWIDPLNVINVGSAAPNPDNPALGIYQGSRITAAQLNLRSVLNQRNASFSASGAGSILNVQSLYADGVRLLINPKISTISVNNGAQIIVADDINFSATELILDGGARMSFGGDFSGSDATDLQLRNGAVLSGGNMVFSAATLSSGSITIGGSSSTAAGTLDVDNITFGLGFGSILFNHNTLNYIFRPSITTTTRGIMFLTVSAGDTTLTGKNTYTGSTQIRGGSLIAGRSEAFSPGSTYEVYSGGKLINNGFSQSLGKVTNDGEITLGGGASPSSVTMNDGYSGQGILTVSGPDNTLNVTSTFVNSGDITVSSGATVNADSLTNSKNVTLTGAGTNLNLANTLNNDGTLIAENGAALAAGEMSNAGGMRISGTGSALGVDGLFTNTGNAQFADGAVVTADAVSNSGIGLFLSGLSTALNVAGQLANLTRLQVLDGATATLGSLSNEAGGVLVSGAGAALNADTIASSGTMLVSDGGSLNASDIILTASSTATPSTLNIGNVSGSSAAGAGSVIADVITLSSAPGSRAAINFNHTSGTYNFAPIITGDGDVSQASGVTTLTGANTYSGTTRISGGTLRAGAGNAFSANSVYDITDDGTLDLNGYSQTTGDLTNAGTVNLAGTRAGAVLTVAGNYAGNNGLLSFGTELGDDRSLSDRLVVTGDITGNTRVRVRNLGGSGAATLNGIELIEVQGNADSNAFTQQGRIVAGAYDYRIYRADKNWYLSNRENLEGALPIIPGDGSENPGGGGENPGGGGGNGGGGSGEMVLRPEGGAYAANLSTAATLFDTRMSDRQGTYYLDPLTGEEKHTSLWLRMSGDHNRVNGGSGQLRTRANSFVTMLGGDVAATDNARLGLMAGYGNSKSNAESRLTGYRAKGQINGYTTGLYGTWFAEGTDEKGLWTDSTLQYSWFNNSVDGEDEPGESYKSKGLSASLSAGYVIPLSAGERTAFFLQPQARVGWSGIKADDHRERNGTLVQGSGQDNVSSSLGVKAFMKGHAATDDNSGRQFGMFTEANWIHNTREYAVRMDDVAVSQSGSRNIAEVRVGLDGALGGGFGIKGTIGQQVGDNGWSDTAAALSVNYRF